MKRGAALFLVFVFCFIACVHNISAYTRAGFVTADEPAPRTWSGDDIVIAGDAPAGEKQPGEAGHTEVPGNGEEGSESAEPGESKDVYSEEGTGEGGAGETEGTGEAEGSGETEGANEGVAGEVDISEPEGASKEEAGEDGAGESEEAGEGDTGEQGGAVESEGAGEGDDGEPEGESEEGAGVDDAGKAEDAEESDTGDAEGSDESEGAGEGDTGDAEDASEEDGEDEEEADINSHFIKNFDKAEILNLFGLFEGTATGYHLELPSTRSQAAVMIVRMLGKEQEAINGDFEHPFIDDVPDWADAHIGYLYHNNITKGTSADRFSPNTEIPAIHFMTFILRILGYDDSNGDFYYTESVEKALEIGLIGQGEYNDLKSRDYFLRDDMVMISYNALKTKIKDSEKTLLDKLVENDGTVSPYLAHIAGMYNTEGIPLSLEEFDKTDIGLTVKNKQQLIAALTASILEFSPNVELDISDYSGDIFEEFEKAIVLAERTAAGKYGLRSVIQFLEHAQGGLTENSISLAIQYLYTDEQLEQTVEKADSIIKEIIAPEMTDYQKVLAVHNYVVKNTQYIGGGIYGNEAYTAYGALVQGEAVCQGYTEAVNILLNRSGVYSMLVIGEGYTFMDWRGHAWNIAKIGGSFYHIDATFDDLGVDESRIKSGKTWRYDYLNVTDSDILTDHYWDMNRYPRCNNTANNYYHVNGLVVKNKEEFIERVTNAINNRESEILLKIINYSEEDYMDVYNIITGTGMVESYVMDHNYNIGVIWIFDLEYI